MLEHVEKVQLQRLVNARGKHICHVAWSNYQIGALFQVKT